MLLTIKNIGLIDNASIRLDGLTVIGGENDMGKSTAGKLMFAITKALSSYNNDFKILQEENIKDLAENIYLKIQSDAKNPEFKDKFAPYNFLDILKDYRRFLTSQEDLDKLFPKIKDFVRYEAILPDTIFASVISNLNKIKDEIIRDENKNELFRQTLSRILNSEFYFELSPNKEPSFITISDNSITLIEVEIQNNEITKTKLNYSLFKFQDTTFLETPLVLQFSELINYANTLSEVLSEDKYTKLNNLNRPTVPLHTKDLMNKLEKATTFRSVSKPQVGGEKILELHNDISEIINGNYEYDRQTRNFIFKRENGKTLEIKSLNTASGIKSFGIIQLLLQAGFIDERTLLIIDEPETRLHPKWQVEYAKLLIELVKNDFNILLTSHSPYMIQALRVFSENEKVHEKTAFYLADKNSKGKVEFENVSSDIKDLFKKLVDPLSQLVWNK